MYKITFIAEEAKVMQKTTDSINITLEMLQIYNNSLWANRRYRGNDEIHEQGSYDIKERLDGIILQKMRAGPSRLMFMSL
ncbi:MAG: hypothetical protein A2W27_05765 [Deltaproteobacteria bacterium RBG_16_44_11]|nr:MAG: hypothetical protein A2W27_05765 [Deltaproteobacteria bacterium RBG_16_44_11]